jgi:tRNA(Arg) A34 adenosine deaminase TadA
MEKLGRNPNDENSGAAWHAEMSALKAAYKDLPPANCPAHAKLHRQAALSWCSPVQRARLEKTMREIGLDF